VIERDLISYIISAYDRPRILRACLATLSVQTEPHELIVCCNSLQQCQIDMHREVANEFGAKCYWTGKWGAACCYSSAEMVIERGHVHGDWLVFPSDDSLYVGRFSEIMMRAAREKRWDLVYCNMVYESAMPLSNYHYGDLEVEAKLGRIDKTGILLRRPWFKKFPGKNPTGSFAMCDGKLIEELIAREIRHGKAPGRLVVHQ